MSIRNLGTSIGHVLREELQPRGVLGGLLFDNAWACLLRRKLITQAEEKLFDQEGKPLNERLKEAGLWGMARAKPQNGVVGELPNLVRYDAYMSREFFRSIGMLLAFRNGGSAGLAQLLCKRFAQAHSQEEAAADADRETSITDLGASEDKITKVG